MSSSLKKFQGLLMEIFQFDSSDLDFGIYRILNLKRELINKYINEELVKKIDSIFEELKKEDLGKIEDELDKAKKNVIDNVAPDAITSTGDIKEEYKNIKACKDYLGVLERKKDVSDLEDIKSQTFNDLYNFFSRYYSEGDFVPQYRYSIKGNRYAIPYNGEEVKLYWANSDQYYTKTGVLFRDYTFFSDGTKEYRVIFRAVNAREELSSNKATKQRFFVLDDELPIELIENNDLIIRFNHRELTEEEVNTYNVGGGSLTSKQEKLCEASTEYILKEVKNTFIKGHLVNKYKNDRSLLLHQMLRYTAKNSRDFFIHKNLMKFLTEQLDFFIKSEVIHIEAIEEGKNIEKHLSKARAVRQIGQDIISFLSQLEEFQKKLWEKKKFVLKTDYIITSDMVPKELHKIILSNKEQKEEWEYLGLDPAESSNDLSNSFYPIDTKHFTPFFKEKLLESLTETRDLDDLLDGLLIKSENWQAINIIKDKYREIVKCVYIDPPYNSPSSEIIYKNNYKHSSWISLMFDRLNISKQLLKSFGTVAVAIDDNEYTYLKEILSMNFNEELETVVVRSNPAGRSTPKGFSLQHEYVVFAVNGVNNKSVGHLEHTEKQIARYDEKDENGQFEWVNFRKHGALKEESPHMYYPIFINKQKLNWRLPEMEWNGATTEWITLEAPNENEQVILPIDENGQHRRWKWGVKRLQDNSDMVKIDKDRTGNLYLYIKSRMPAKGRTPPTWWDKKEYSATDSGTRTLKNLFGQFGSFDYPKAVILVEDCLKVAMVGKTDNVLDYFAGSGSTGHAVMNLNKDDNGKRKYILVEMANYFETVLVPRLKKVSYSFNWKDGKPKDKKGISQFIKYQHLEQYEDTLDNIELTPDKVVKKLFKDDYLLKYFLEFETKENATLLSIDNLKKPFSYKIRVNFEEIGDPEETTVDIPETFNYLLGLKVKKIKYRESDKNKYIFILGEKNNRDIAVVWRNCEDNWNDEDYSQDKVFVVENLLPWKPHIIYINGQSILTPKLGESNVEVRYIEAEFRRLME